MDEKKRQRYLAISEKLAELVGGKKNIQGIAHCATRLRIVLENNDVVDLKAIEDLDLVKGVFVAGDQLQIIFGADAFPFPSIFGDKTMDVGGLKIVPQDIWNTLVGILLVVLLMLFLKKTRIGKAMRATAQDREAARLMGVNVRRCMSGTFILASAIGGFAGMLLAPKYFVIASLGTTFGNKGFAAALFGGISSNAGSMVGGVVLGILETLAAVYGKSTWQTAIAFIILFLVLVVKPTGLMGKKDVRKV